MGMEGLEELRRRACRMASEDSRIAGVILFGSRARGEENLRSDTDILILWDDSYSPGATGYRQAYTLASRHFSPSRGLTVLEMGYSEFLGARRLTPILLNIIGDGVVLYDRHGRLEQFISDVRRRLRRRGVVRVKMGRYYYWELPEPGAKIVV